MDESWKKKSSKKESVLPNYKIGKSIGHGAFSKVKLAKHLATGHKVAIKIIDRKKVEELDLATKVEREIQILRALMHPRTIRLYEVVETPEHIYLVMEFAGKGELFDYIVEKGRLSEEEARRIFQQIISGVEYCHHIRVVHRDLKPENIIMDWKEDIKIADFGLSNIMYDGHLLKTSCGSPNYAAPEVLAGEPYAGPEVDIWSCGVILYALVCGQLPFDDAVVPNLFGKIKRGEYTLPNHLSRDVKDLIPRMLTVEPLRRISIPEIRQHPWFHNDLPHDLAVPPSDAREQAYNKIDEKIVQEVVNLGFDRNQVVESLVGRIQNQATVSYYLILDNSRRVPVDDSQSESTEISDGTSSSIFELGVVTSHVGHSFPALVDHHMTGLGPQAIVDNDNQWNLGLQSRAHPGDIMDAVFKAFQNLDVCWKHMKEYNMKCRWVHKSNSSNENSNVMEEDCAMISPIVLKFEIQLYKKSAGLYLLDIQRLNGPQFVFFDLCVRLLSELGVI
ncbi:unnamed protein product [Microthlaspi erraticum]|uniref:non-specific serine/threonine protein kinase n=1 Tax=Microthlaspi erraticum TaxID=1685480 RepID=A0A6D2KQM9_9BRAS|nr:unnamed protein product [Microthlaspi erraticum]